MKNDWHDPLARPEGYVTTADELKCPASLVLLVKNIADTLERHYPGWLWAVRPDHLGGVIDIFSMRLSGQWGYRVLTKNIQNDASLRLALIAGGEILERFGQRRGPYSYSRWAAQPTRFGMKDFDISDKSAKERRRRRDDDFTQAVRSGAIKLRVVDRKTETGVQRDLYVQPSAFWEK